MRVLHREPVIAALASKAAATKAAIVHLAKGGFGADAYNLARTLLENMIVLEWLLHKDPALRERRIDTFILHMEAFLVRFEQVRLEGDAKHGRTPDPDYGTTARTREISAELFDDKWTYWAWMKEDEGKQRRAKNRKKAKTSKKTLVKMREMAEEVGFSDFYEREYFLMSAFVHSAPASVFEHSDGPAETIHKGKKFAIRPELFANPKHFVTQSVALSNIYMIHVLGLLDTRFELGVKDEITFLHALYLLDPSEWPEFLEDGA